MRKVMFTIFSLVIILGMCYSPAMADAPVVDPRANGLGDPVEAFAEVIEDGSAIATYFVLLDGEALAGYSGDVPGLRATTPSVTGARKLDATSAASVAYLDYLHGKQDAFLSSLSPLLGRAATYIYRYDAVLNGFAMELSAGQARSIAKMAGVRAVIKDEIRQLDTDTSPEFLGVDTLWTETGSTPGDLSTKGEGMLIGVLDTGINMDHPSFAAVGPVDGYTHINPFGTGVFKGLCASNPTQYICNDKLVGVYGYTTEAVIGEDAHAHGSHTSSTAAGNALTADYNGLTVNISGMAPHANIIMYDVCTVDGCANTGSTAAVNQAILDGVDVLNYSIGPSSGASDPYADTVELAMLDAMAAGILTATSAGNSGPNPSTVYKAPAWDIVVANSSHNRSFGVNVIVDVDPTAADSFEMTGVIGTGPALTGSILGSLKWAGPSYTEGCNTTPFPVDYFDGYVALISRGTCGFAEKVANATTAGADAVVVYNNRGGPAIVMGALEATTIPAVMVDQEDGLAAVEYLTVTHPTDDVTVEITDTFVRRVKDSWADIIDSQTSRGPYLLHDILEPEVAAPGTNIMAAYNTPVDTNPFGQVDPGDVAEVNLMSGTSMASPHVAGSALLLMDLFPTWTPMEIKSALMMTADTSTMLKDNGTTPADIFDVGNGRIDLTKAALTGLVMDEVKASFVAADPAEDGDVKTLNIPSYQNSQCIGDCSFTRTFKNVADVETAYTVMVDSSEDIEIVVTPSSFSIPVGGTQVVTFDIDVSAAEIGTWQFAYVSFETEDAFTTGEDISDVRIPLAIMPDPGNLPALVEQTVYRDAGGTVLKDLYSIEITNMVIDWAGLTEADIYDFQLDPDPTPGDAFDDLGDVWYTTFTIPVGAKRMVLEVLETTSADLDLFWGYGSTPSAATLYDSAATGAALEYYSWLNPWDDPYWVLIQNYDGAPADEVKLAIGIVPDADAGNFDVTGPSSVIAGDLFDLELTWDEPDMEPYSAWYGWFSVGSDEGVRAVTEIGETEVNIYRPYDDVTKEASTEAADVGETVTYTITIAPNPGSEDLDYDIEDMLPAGVTYVPGSLDTTGTFTDATYDAGSNSINWVGTMPMIEYTYIASTPDNNPEYCDTPFGGGYLDLKSAYGVNPSTGIAGDSYLWSYTSLGVGTQFYGETIPTKPTFTSDGYFYMYPYGGTADWWNWNGQQFPDPTVPNAIVAPFMRDMVIVAEAGVKGVSAVSFGSGALWLTEFDDIEDFDTDASMDYEVWVYRDLDPSVGYPDIVFAYDNVMGDWEQAGPGPWGSVGLENVTGTVGTDFAYDNWTPESGDIVCLDFAADGAEPVVITFDVVVDDVADESITNTTEHTADGFGMRTEEASAAFDVNLTLSDLDLYFSLDEVAWDMVPGSFEEGFALLMDPLEPFYYLDADHLVVNRTLADGMYPFFLDQTNLPSDFFAYWDAKGVNASAAPDTWQVVMWPIINGDQPMFFLDVDGMSYDLIDALQYLGTGGTVVEALRISGDYPIGLYTFTGVVEDVLGLTDDVMVDIEFLAPFELTDLDLYSSIDEVAWEMVPGEFDTGFALAIDPINEFYYLDANNIVTNRILGDGMYPFLLDQTDLPSDFFTYWDAKGVNALAAPGTWQFVMWEIINGNQPIFFLKVDGTSYDLIDGLRFMASGMTVEEPLRVSGDYPLGTYTFTGDVADEFGYTDDVEVMITFNDAPMAYDQVLETVEDTPLAITLTADDVFPGDPFTWMVDDPMHGVLTGVAPALTYTPDADYYGPDSFTFYVNDGYHDSNVATITIDVTPVDDSPVAVDDYYTTPMSTTLTVAAPGVMANDILVDPEELTMVILVTGTQHGTVQLYGDGSFVYIPVDGYIGMDGFVYNVLSLPTRSIIDQGEVFIDVTGYIYYMPFINR